MANATASLVDEPLVGGVAEVYAQLARPPSAGDATAAFTMQHSHLNWSRHPDMDIIEGKGVQAFFFICYTTIFVLGVFGNVLVCYVVGRNRAMQTVTNFFITNLALSDILLCILAVPFTPLYSFLGQWIFGRALCHLVAYAQGTSVYISTLTLTSIAIDRFFVIIYPFHPRMQLTTCAVIISSIWLFSVFVTLPYGLYMNHKFENGRHYCEETWPSESFRQIYGVLTAVLQFLVPFLIIAFCYVRVSLKLRDRARLKPGCKSSRKEEADRERKRRTNRMLIAMVTIFGVSWMPLNVINLLNDVYIPTGNWRYYYLVFFTVHALAMSSTCYNPFLYAWLNDNFRKEFKQVLPCFDPSGVQACGHTCSGACGSGFHHHHHHHHGTGTDGMGCVEGGRGGLGGDLALPCPGRRSISSAVRTMTTTDDWANKSASHSPPTPTGPANNHLVMASSRDSSPDQDRVPLTSMAASLRGRKADSVEVESVVMETNNARLGLDGLAGLTSTAAGRAEGEDDVVGAATSPEGGRGERSSSPTSAAQEANAFIASGVVGRLLPSGVGATAKHRAKSRLFGSAAARNAAPQIHRQQANSSSSSNGGGGRGGGGSSGAGASLLLPNDAVSS